MTLTPYDVTAVIVTRGDVDLNPIIATLPYAHMGIWDNSKMVDAKVFGRYLGALLAPTPYIYVQDDDIVFTKHKDLLAAYEPGKLLINNVDYDPKDFGVVGWGAIFEKSLMVKAMNKYLAKYPWEDQFMRYCDYIMVGLNELKRVDLGHKDLPYATADNRMYHQSNHEPEKTTMMERARVLRDDVQLG